MHDTIVMLSGAAKFIGGLLIVFGGMWLLFNLNQQNRITGPILMMAAGGVVAGMADPFADVASPNL